MCSSEYTRASRRVSLADLSGIIEYIDSRTTIVKTMDVALDQAFRIFSMLDRFISKSSFCSNPHLFMTLIGNISEQFSIIISPPFLSVDAATDATLEGMDGGLHYGKLPSSRLVLDIAASSLLSSNVAMSTAFDGQRDITF
jgi:hypothetical protein